jgi:serine/threonine protein phosphatase 1
MIVHFETNTTGRDFVVGDLHGEFSQFAELRKAVSFDTARDRIFCVGDLIDRGEDSEAVLGLLSESWFFSVIGNHEQMLLMTANDMKFRGWWVDNGGGWCATRSIQRCAEAVFDLPLAISVGDGEERFNVIHAEFFGSDTDLDAGNFDAEVRERLLWGRSLVPGHADHISQHGLSPTYCGHTIVKAPFNIGRHHFIDTGAFTADGALTMVEPKTGVAVRSTGGGLWK